MNNLRFFLFTMVLVLFAAAKPAGYQLGDVVADFSLKNVDGTKVALSGFKDAKGVIVIFDCNTCPYSKMYNERIAALNKKYKAKGVPVISINANDPDMSPGDSFQEMVSVAKRKKYDYPYLVDESQAVARAFGATNTPHVFLLENKGGQFVVAYIGAIDNNPRDAASADKHYVEDAVESLLSGNDIQTKRTKAIGCGIKYRNT
jgi:peroxiredoxin